MPDVPTKVLIIDDSEADRATFRYFLEGQQLRSYAIQDARTGEEGISMCESFLPDCVLLDFGLPDCDGIEVLTRIREQFGWTAIAAVFLTGAGDERLAAEVIKRGAQDYLPKHQVSPELLRRAVQNAIEKVAQERDRQRIEKALAANERKLQAIVSTAPSVVYIFDLRTRSATFVNEYSRVVIGYSPEEIIAMGPEFSRSVIDPEDRPLVEAHFSRLMEAGDGQEFECEYNVRRKDGGSVCFLSRDRVFERDAGGRVTSIVGAATDITEKRQTEQALRNDQLRIRMAEQAAKVGFWDWNIGEDRSHCSPSYFALYGQPADTESPTFEEWTQMIHPDDRATALQEVHSGLSGAPYHNEFRVIWPDGSVHWLSARATVVMKDGRPARFIGANIDITERKAAEQEIRDSHERLQALMDVVPAAVFTATDSGSTRIEGNRMAYELLELQQGKNLSRTAVEEERPENFRVTRGEAEVPGDELPIQTVARTGQPIFGHECELEFKDGRKRYLYGNVLPLLDLKGQPAGALSAYLDVTQWKRIEQELRRSNQDLEYFASMAGHDLQEPLRSIISFAELVNRKPNLPSDLQSPLEFIRVGAQRMKDLIADLLAYAQTAAESRRTMKAISVSEALREALTGLDEAIQESGAEIIFAPLPTLVANGTQIKQLFQNLIGNALKYRSERPPEIRILAERRGNDWLFAVRDNGIGMDMQYADLIFEPFKRLHGRGQYSGTGIGLAICKRVVEQHRGRIWVESQPGQGSTFCFTLAESPAAPKEFETWPRSDASAAGSREETIGIKQAAVGNNVSSGSHPGIENKDLQ